MGVIVCYDLRACDFECLPRWIAVSSAVVTVNTVRHREPYGYEFANPNTTSEVAEVAVAVVIYLIITA